MKKSELKAEILLQREQLRLCYLEINNLKILLKAGEILDEEEENATCPIDLERVAAAI